MFSNRENRGSQSLLNIFPDPERILLRVERILGGFRFGSVLQRSLLDGLTPAPTLAPYHKEASPGIPGRLGYVEVTKSNHKVKIAP